MNTYLISYSELPSKILLMMLSYEKTSASLDPERFAAIRLILSNVRPRKVRIGHNKYVEKRI